MTSMDVRAFTASFPSDKELTGVRLGAHYYRHSTTNCAPGGQTITTQTDYDMRRTVYVLVAAGTAQALSLPSDCRENRGTTLPRPWQSSAQGPEDP